MNGLGTRPKSSEWINVTTVLVISVLFIAGIGMIGGCGDGTNKGKGPEGDKPPAAPKAQMEETDEGPVPLSSITLGEIAGYWVRPANLTKAQQDSFDQDRERQWIARYRNKWVRWQGKVKDVVRTKDDINVLLDLAGHEHPKTEVELHVAERSRDKALKAFKGSDIIFVGKLTKIPTAPGLMSNSRVIVERVIIK
jgi:hypothetical protein